MYRNLRAEEVVKTSALLHVRIKERFPTSGLCKIAQDVWQVADGAVHRVALLARPMWLLRGLNYCFLLTIGALLAYVVLGLGLKPSFKFKNLNDFITVLEPALGAVVFIGAFVLLVWSVELRIKRGRAFAALHELRSMAHTIDMHQLTKDPGRHLFPGEDTESSPKRPMTPFELSRYFDYCSELLSMISKIAALYAQNLGDAEALEGVDQVEALTTGLSRKIWQKIMILERYHEDAQPIS